MEPNATNFAPSWRYSLLDVALTMTVLCIGLSLSRSLLFFLCSPFYFCYFMFLLRERRKLSTSRSVVISAVSAISLSMAQLVLLLTLYPKRHDPDYGMSQYEPINLIMGNVCAGFILIVETLPIAWLWYCSALYRDTLREKTRLQAEDVESKHTF